LNKKSPVPTPTGDSAITTSGVRTYCSPLSTIYAVDTVFAALTKVPAVAVATPATSLI